MSNSSKKLPLFLSSNEVSSLVSGIKKDRHKLGVALMSYGGLRVSEMCNLTVADINLARGFMKITGKGDKQRFVPLTSKLQSMIEKYLSKYGSCMSQETFILGKTRASWHYVVKKYSNELLGRSDIHCHTLRHSFATCLYEEGVQIERISELLGHSRIDTTMIYSHISMNQKRESIMVLDNKRSKVLSILKPVFKKKHEISVKRYANVIGRDKETKELNEYIDNKVSVILLGQKGVGKSAIIRNIDKAIFINEFRKKNTLIDIILAPKNLSKDVYKETAKELKKLSIDELLEEIEFTGHVIVIDDISELSKPDRRIVSKLAMKTVVITSSSRNSDKKLFKTFIEIKSLRRHHTRIILSEMIHMNDHKKKESIVDDILHTAGDNLKEAEYIANQLQLGKSTEEVTTDERHSNQVSIAPVLLIFVLFFVAWVLKSYTTSMVAFSYAMLVVFRLLFYKYLFGPVASNKKR